MVTTNARRFREFFAFGLLGVAALYVVSGLSVLFKSRDDSFLDFSGRAALVSHAFMDPILVVSLAAAVVLAIVWGESPHARVIVLGALGIGAIALIFGLISWLAGLTADELDGLPAYGGLVGAGKVVGVFLGLAQLAFLALVLFFAATVFASLPRPVRMTQEQWGQLYGTPPPQGWGPPTEPWAPQQPQATWGAAPQQQPGWGAPSPGSGTDPWTPPAPQASAAPAEPAFEPEPAPEPEPEPAPFEPAPFEPPAEPGAHLGDPADPPAETSEAAAGSDAEQAADDDPTHDSSGWWRPSSS